MKEIFFLYLNKVYSFYNKRIPRIPGIPLVYSIFYRRFNPNTLLLIDVQNYKMYVDTKERGVVPFLILNGVYEEYETELFKSLVNENTTLIDIGANIGYYTLLGAKIIKKGFVYAFEPEPANYEILLKNIKINNLNNVNAINEALSNNMGNAKIFLDEFNFGTHSLAEENVPDKLNYMKVATTTLDAFFKDKYEELDNLLIKMDTQGAEGLIIDGADSLLEKESIKIMMEFWPMGLKNMGTEPELLLEKLGEYGFKISVINNQKNCLEYANYDKIIKNCEISQDGYANYVNLFIEK